MRPRDVARNPIVNTGGLGSWTGFIVDDVDNVYEQLVAAGVELEAPRTRDHSVREITPLGVSTELAAMEPDRFFIPAYTGKRGWLGIRLDVDVVDWDEVARLIEDAYRLTAPKSLVAHLDVRQR